MENFIFYAVFATEFSWCRLVKTNLLHRSFLLWLCNTFLYKQHFYKQNQAEIGKKQNKC